MAKEFLRQLSLVVSSATQSIDFGSFWCTFNVKRGDFQTPNSCDVRIYNLKKETANQIAKLEFTTLTLSAGYQTSPIGLLFSGSIVQFRQGRVDQLDSYVDITAADSDEAYNFAPVSTTIRAGSKPGSIASALLAAFQRASSNQPITPGYQPNFKPDPLVRGRVVFGMARDEARDFANQNDCKWSFQDGALTYIPFVSFIPGGEVPVISVSSGLIGVPEQTQSGINIRTLLNANYKIGQLVRLDSQINQFRFPLDQLSQGSNTSVALQNQLAPTLANPNSSNPSDQQGLYYVMVANHVGNTRGQEWYTDLTCLSVDATLQNRDQTNALLQTGKTPIFRYGGT